MLVLAALIYVKPCESLAAECVVGDHTLDSKLKSKLGLLFHKLVISYGLHVTDVACVMIIELLLCLFACENCLFDVGNDNEIAAVYVRCEGGLILTAKKICYLYCKTAEGLARCVYYIPLALNLARFCHIS